MVIVVQWQDKYGNNYNQLYEPVIYVYKDCTPTFPSFTTTQTIILGNTSAFYEFPKVTAPLSTCTYNYKQTRLTSSSYDYNL